MSGRFFMIFQTQGVRGPNRPVYPLPRLTRTRFDKTWGKNIIPWCKQINNFMKKSSGDNKKITASGKY